MVEEYSIVMRNDVWSIVSRPKRKSVGTSQSIYQIKPVFNKEKPTNQQQGKEQPPSVTGHTIVRIYYVQPYRLQSRLPTTIWIAKHVASISMQT